MATTTDSPALNEVERRKRQGERAGDALGREHLRRLHVHDPGLSGAEPVAERLGIDRGSTAGLRPFGRYPPPAIWAGTAAQIAKYAVPTIREGWETFFAITEPSGGSDPADIIQSRAERRGDRWVLNGRKVFRCS
jgi:alkylation response protein AidB-like acyl-CoA dehydrogenase